MFIREQSHDRKGVSGAVFIGNSHTVGRGDSGAVFIGNSHTIGRGDSGVVLSLFSGPRETR